VDVCCIYCIYGAPFESFADFQDSRFNQCMAAKDLVGVSHKIDSTAEIWISKIKREKWRFFIRRVKLQSHK